MHAIYAMHSIKSPQCSGIRVIPGESESRQQERIDVDRIRSNS